MLYLRFSGILLANIASGNMMIELTPTEIQEELKKFGVEAPSELHDFVEEYLEYLTIEYSGGRS